MKTDHMPSGLACNYYRKGATQAPHQARRLQMVRRLLKTCSGQLLDYGCGYGDIAYAISPAFTSVVGVDVSEDRITWARKEFAPVQFRVCDGDKLDFQNASFQTVISIVVINWVENPDQYLAECYRVLSLGGNLVIAVAAPDPIRTFTRKLLRKSPVHTQFWTENLAAMSQRLRHHDFEIKQVDCFFEPWSDILNSWKQACLTAINLPMRVCRVPAFAPYYGVRAVKTDKELYRT